MQNRQPDPHDVPGFTRATGIDDPTPRHEYGDQDRNLELAERREQVTPTETNTEHLEPDEARRAAAEELREAADAVENGDDETADLRLNVARDLVTEAKAREP